MSLIILSSLGVGKYRTARYRLEESQESILTESFAIALHQWYPEAEVKILATKAAQDSENGQLLKERHPDFQFHVIPEGKTDSEAWKIFQIIADSNILPDNSRVIFDVTHGLRSFPTLGFLALSYLKVIRNLTIEKVYYGALDLTPRDQENAETPVLDLTALIQLLDWAHAAKRFQDTGDARLFEHLLKMNRKADYNAVSRRLKDVSEAIFKNRGPNITEEANKLLSALNLAQQGNLEIQQQPFSLIMQQIEQQIKPISAPKDDYTLTLQAQYALICWYAERNHYTKAMSLAREWLISVRQWHQSGTFNTNKEKRERINDDIWNAINKIKEQKKRGDKVKTDHKGIAIYPDLDSSLNYFASAIDSVGDLRNDMAHFGFTDQKTVASRIDNKVKNILLFLPQAVKPLGLDLDPASNKEE